MDAPLPRTNLLKRLFCLSMSPLPEDPGCWEIREDRVTVDLARAGILRTPGGALRLEGPALPDRILLVHGEDGVFRAVRNRCACGGFRVDPVPGEPKVRCVTPMQGTYDAAEGRSLSSHVQKAVDILPVTREGDRLVVDASALRGVPPPHERKPAP